MQLLKRCTGLGTDVYFKYKGMGGKYRVGKVVDVVSVLAGEYHHLIQRIELDPIQRPLWGDKYAYRTGYYTLAAKSRAVKWGQFHQAVPAKAYATLMRKAAKKGWLPNLA